MTTNKRNHTLLRRILIGTLGMSACAAAAFTSMPEASAQAPVVVQQAATKATITGQDGSLLSCDIINGMATNCIVIQAAPQKAPQPVQVVPQQPQVVYQTAPQPVPVAPQPAVVPQAAAKTTVTGADGSILSCDIINGMATNCVVVQAAPQVAPQPVQVAPQQPQVVYQTAPQPVQAAPQQPQVAYQPVQQPGAYQVAPQPGAYQVAPDQQIIQQPAQSSASGVFDGHFFAGLGLGYAHTFYTMQNTYGKNELDKDYSNSFSNGFFIDITAGYEFKYFGIFTSLDIIYSWSTKDAINASSLVIEKVKSTLEDGYELEELDEEDKLTNADKSTINTLFTNWSIGPLAHYSISSMDLRFLFGVGVAHLTGDGELKGNHWKKTFDLTPSNFFSMKMTLQLDYKIGEHFRIGPSLSWLYVMTSTCDEYEKGVKDYNKLVKEHNDNVDEWNEYHDDNQPKKKKLESDDFHMLMAGLNFTFSL